MAFEQMPKVSVIIPLYNREEAIGYALESVLTQNYPIHEVVVVDDCSTDGSAEVVEGLRDPRVCLLRHDKNKGASAARNTGIRAAGGEYIAFQDSDDFWVPGKLALQMKQFDRKNYKGELDEGGPDLVYSAFRRHWRGKSDYIPGDEFSHLPKEGFIVRSLLLKNFITPQAVVARRICFEKAGYFNENLSRFHDWELWLRMSQQFKFAYIDQALVDVYHSKKSISANQEHLITALKYIIEHHYDLYARAGNKFLSGIVFSYGHNLCLGGKVAAGRAELIKTLRINPWSVKSIVALMLSLTGSSFYKRLYKLF